MPLIIVSGLPTSGKSTRAKQLYDYLALRLAGTESPKYRLHLISDDSLSISRAVYDLAPESIGLHTRSANSSEKDARAAFFGAVKRVLSDKDFVILDGLNYIKGWRYQLHCEAKAMRTPCCVLRVACSTEQARKINEGRLAQAQAQLASPTTTDVKELQSAMSNSGVAEPYERSNWDNLVFRYEEPNPMTRWDSPLFAVLWEDDEHQTKKTFGDLWDALAGESRKIIKPNQSTVQRGPVASGDFLYVLERETQEVVKMILEQQSDEGGGEVKIPFAASGREEAIVDLPTAKRTGLPQLQRLRRAFVGLNRGGIGLERVETMAGDGIRETFVKYLNDAFEKDQ